MTDILMEFKLDVNKSVKKIDILKFQSKFLESNKKMKKIKKIKMMIKKK
jgi:hypothetical protein